MTLQNSMARFQISQNSQVVIGKNYRTLQPDQIQFGLIAITRELIEQAQIVYSCTRWEILPHTNDIFSLGCGIGGEELGHSGQS